MLLIGNAGFAPGLSGGMIPSTAPPFAMTRWIAQTRQNYVSMTPYNWTDNAVHGFQGTRQPAIWMGESGPVFVVPGVALTEEGFHGVEADFESRGMTKKNGSESISPALYSISLDDGLGGEILAQQSATSRVGHLRFTFTGNGTTPYILLESSRPSVITSTPTNITYPNGTISILLSHGKVHEISWEAVWKDATVPPINDLTTVYSDRQENVDYEARGGLNSTYAQNGWVADDIHSESGSRTLDYAYDDYAVYKVALALGKPANITDFLLERSLRAPTTIYNNDTGFVEARDANGSWAGDKWIYSFDAIQDIPGLIERRGGNQSFVASLDAHFDGGHNYHPNEPSHHIPYLYALAGAAYKTQERVREIAQSNYNNTLFGLSGNDDCGQMSSWYIFSAMGFYPVTPVSGEYVVGSPFFDKITISLPPKPQDHTKESKILTISALGAPSKPYIKSLTINGKAVDSPIIRHEDIVNGGTIEFEMSDVVEAWGNGVLVKKDSELAMHALRLREARLPLKVPEVPVEDFCPPVLCHKISISPRIKNKFRVLSPRGSSYNLPTIQD
ncbi:hypothetical protein H0H93_010715 [Arthromyces matolae]|nr:hypothetical protein H0H93_010715 [Arthromyces matolae]